MDTTMKRKLVSIFTAFVLVFSMIPFMPALAGNTAYAASSYVDSLAGQGFDARTPVSKIEYSLDADKLFNKITFTVDCSVIDDQILHACHSATLEVRRVSDDAWLAAQSTSFDSADIYENGAYDGSFEWSVNLTGDKRLKPGEEFHFYVAFCEDTQGDYPWNNYFTGAYWSAPQLSAEDSFVADANFSVDTTYYSLNGSYYTYKNDGLVYSKTFKADATKELSGECKQYLGGGSTDTQYWSAIYDSKGNQVFKTSAGQAIFNYSFTKADTYTFKHFSGNTTGKSMNYVIKLNMKDKHVYSYKWDKLTAKVIYDEARTSGCYVELTPGTYDGDDTPNMQFYKQDLDTGKFVKVDAQKSASWWYYDNKTDLGQNLKYYLVNANKLSYASSMPTGIDYVTLSSSAKADLESKASTSIVNIEGPEVPSISNLTNTKGVKTATLEWIGPMGDDIISYYKVQRFDANGNLKATFKPQADTYYMKKTYYVPYAGTHTFKVTPILERNGKTYAGNTLSIKVSSKKISAPGGGVTKISASKAKVTVVKPIGADGVRVWKKTNGSWKVIKTFNPGTPGKKTTHRFAWTKNSAGTSRYKFQSFVKDKNGVTYYHKAVGNIAYKTPGANQCTYNISSSQSSYGDLDEYWKPNKLYYSNGKVMLTGCFINTHDYAVKYIKAKVTIKCDGKVVGTKVINSGRIAGNSSKNHSAVVLSTTAGHDLRNGEKKWSYKITDWSF